MTKTEMLDYIEKTGCVIDFDRKYLMRKSKSAIERLYEIAVNYSARKG